MLTTRTSHACLHFPLSLQQILDLSHVPFSHHTVAGNRADASPSTMTQVCLTIPFLAGTISRNNAHLLSPSACTFDLPTTAFAEQDRISWTHCTRFLPAPLRFAFLGVRA